MMIQTRRKNGLFRNVLVGDVVSATPIGVSGNVLLVCRGEIAMTKQPYEFRATLSPADLKRLVQLTEYNIKRLAALESRKEVGP